MFLKSAACKDPVCTLVLCIRYQVEYGCNHRIKEKAFYEASLRNVSGSGSGDSVVLVTESVGDRERNVGSD